MTPSDPTQGPGADPGRVVDARPGSNPADPPAEPEVTEPVDGAGAAAPGPVADLDDEVQDELEELEEEVEAAAEVVESDLATLAGERDQYLDQLRRLQADFENYRKRVQKQQEELAERATDGLVSDLLPVLDAFEAALAHGDASVEPLAKALLDVLGKQGLERISPRDEPFDPTLHEAVTHEPGDDGPVCAEVLRPGYVWKGRVLRPAMVRVRG